MHREYMVLCPSYNDAVTEWQNARHRHIWVCSSRTPLTLLNGPTAIRFIFCSEHADVRKIERFRGTIIGPEEFRNIVDRLEKE